MIGEYILINVGIFMLITAVVYGKLERRKWEKIRIRKYKFNNDISNRYT